MYKYILVTDLTTRTEMFKFKFLLLEQYQHFIKNFQSSIPEFLQDTILNFCDLNIVCFPKLSRP